MLIRPALAPPGLLFLLNDTVTRGYVIIRLSSTFFYLTYLYDICTRNVEAATQIPRRYQRAPHSRVYILLKYPPKLNSYKYGMFSEPTAFRFKAAGKEFFDDN